MRHQPKNSDIQRKTMSIDMTDGLADKNHIFVRGRSIYDVPVVCVSKYLNKIGIM